MEEATKVLSFLNYNEQLILEGIIQKITPMYPMINKIVFYGSKARGDFTEESDIDIIFITDYALPRSLKFEIYDAIYEFEVEYDVIISVVFVSKEVFEAKITPFIRQVHREGITLWSRG